MKTRTQLLKLHLKPAKAHHIEAVVDGAFGRYYLYNQQRCVPVEQKVKKKLTRT